MKRFLIDLETIPDEGKSFSGEIDPEVFDLPAGDAQPASPLTFSLLVQRFGSELLLTGQLSATFQFECVRSLHPFIQTIHVDDAAIAFEITTQGEIDATEAIREEVVLRFPTDPRCDQADDPQICQVDSRYLAVDKPTNDDVENPPRDESDDRWSALDALKPNDP